VLIGQEKFQSEYGHLYEKALQEARDYVAHPDKLKAALELRERRGDPMQLRAPEADPYSYRLTLYRGFIRFPQRLKNFIIAENEPKSLTRSFLPTIMDVEPNSRCNFRCIMCQVSGWRYGRRAEDLGVDELKAFVEEQPGLIEVKLHGMGEPLLHERYFEMVQYLSELHIWVRTNINGSLLHVRNNYLRLIDSGIGEVQASFDGATKEVFEKIRRKSNFERVMENLTLLNDYANQQDRPYTRMWVLVQKYNRHQVFEFVKMAKRMGFRRLTFSLSLNDWGQESWQAKNNDLQATGDFSEEELRQLATIGLQEGIDISIWKQAAKYSTENLDTICSWPFNRPYISCDLRVVPCCMIANPEIADLGDAKDFKQVWNGPAYQAFRQAHLDGQIPKVCRGCYVS